MTESDLENACIAWFQELEYDYKAGPDIALRGSNSRDRPHSAPSNRSSAAPMSL